MGYEDEYVNRLSLDTSSFLAALRGAGSEFEAVKLRTTAFAQALDDVSIEQAKATATARSFSQALEAMKVDEAQLEPVVESATAALSRQATANYSVAASASAVTEGHANLGRGVLQTSYAVQDFTAVLSGGGGLSRALGSVQNNIPVLLEQLGMSAGLAGTVSLVSVGLGVAIPLLMQFAGAEKEAAGEAKKLAAEVEKLDMMRTGAQDATAKGVGAFMKELPPITVKQGISAELSQRALFQGREDERRQLQDFGVITESAERFAERMRPNIQKDTERLYTSLDTDQESRKFVAGLADIRPGNFPGNFAADLRSFDSDTGDKDLADAEAFGARAHAGVENRASNRAAAEERRGRVQARQKKEDASIEQAADEEDAKRKRVSRNLDKATDEAIDNEESLARDAKREAAERKQEAARAAAAAKAKARADDPSNRMAADLAGQRDSVTAEAMRQWQQGGKRESLPDLQSIISHAVDNLPDAGGNVARAVQMAAQSAYQKAQMDMARALQRQEAWSNQRGGQ